ncbi:polycomb group protein EMBRYONIC FLOWER 2-like isoform X2 [Rutidosis leptorrhynchoides]|uniref:polycomb group protein EMBRYONIC FLOWER 2-like isoform X2 n=1 Tax=Rutidosis leptorrhynchoides TaxID=125765 RepID=UPI003A99BEDB
MMLQRFSDDKPRFLSRTLGYRIQNKNKRRIKLSVSIPNGSEARNLFPFYILLAKPIPTQQTSCSKYRFKRASVLTVVNGAKTVSSAEVKLILPEYNILSTLIVNGSVALLLVSCEDMWQANDVFKGYCRMGKISLDFLQSSIETSRNLSRGEKIRATSEVSMESCNMKLDCSGEEKHISFSAPHKSNTVSILQQVPVICAAQELGAKDLTPYDLNECNNVLNNSNVMPQNSRLKAGNVIFNYRYYNNTMQRSEVTENYGCPFCLLKCGSYKGLTYHLTASHDLFHFDFSINEDYQAVYVSVVSDALIFENIGSSIHKMENYSIRRMPTNARKSSTQSHNPNKEHQLVLTSDTPATVSDSRGVFEHAECNLPGPSTTSASNHTVVTRSGPQSRALQVTGRKCSSRKLSNKRSNNSNLLQSGQFYHSRTNQPMALEQVYADHDSEDEVDDDIADLEDQWLLNDFVDVSMDEKQMMHLWNSFVRRQRVLANRHIPWACEAFSVKHGEDLAKIHWCWSLFLIKLYNQGVVDAKTIDKCNSIVRSFL